MKPQEDQTPEEYGHEVWFEEKDKKPIKDASKFWKQKDLKSKDHSATAKEPEDQIPEIKKGVGSECVHNQKTKQKDTPKENTNVSDVQLKVKSFCPTKIKRNGNDRICID